jgi:uncharacterized protein YbbK (DUF523 family)
MEKILVSACMVGRKVRYDASDVETGDERLERWREEGRLVAFCPELAGGFPVPRPPAEIEGGRGGDAVLDGGARVLEDAGGDVTGYFRKGAEAALEAARAHGARMAVLKEGSPSCGSSRVYDGTFSGRSVPGRGVTAALLERAGVRVFSEEETAEAEAYLRRLEQEA